MNEDFYDAITTYVEAQDPLTQLIHWAPLEIFLNLSIPLYAIPKVYESLPIKPTFKDLTSLKRHYIDRSILSLYKDLDLSLDSISLFTYVIADGYGDFTFQETLAKELKRLFPQTQIHLVTLFHEEKKVIKSQQFAHDVFTYPGQSLTKECLEKMASTDLIFQSPTYYEGWKEIEPLLKGVQVEHLGEYGFIDSPHFHPQSGARCLGLHFLEKGVLIPHGINEKPLPPLKNRYLAYLRSERGFIIFFAMLCTLKEDIEIVIPIINSIFSHIERLKSFAKLYSIAKIEIYTEEDICPIKIQSEGKTIKIFLQSHIPQNEFIDLMKTSPIVGCRGNQSLLEALALSKPFFYDPVKHNLPFLHNLTILVQDRLPQLAPLFSLFNRKEGENIEEWLLIGEKLADIFASSSLSCEIFSLFNLLKTEYCFNPILEGIVKRAAFIKKYPQHSGIEQGLISKMIQKKEPFESLYFAIKEKVYGSTYRNG
jgi:hypothetical protein